MIGQRSRLRTGAVPLTPALTFLPPGSRRSSRCAEASAKVSPQPLSIAQRAGPVVAMADTTRGAARRPEGPVDEIVGVAIGDTTLHVPHKEAPLPLVRHRAPPDG
jgi:hypothetical protein